MYFDNNATTKPSKEVIADVTWCLENVWGNPSSIHSEGVKARQILEQSREKVAKYIGADSDEIIFCSSGSEANNLAIKGFLGANNMYDCIITTQIEHPSVYNTCLRLFENEFYRIGFAPVGRTGKVNVHNCDLVTRIKSALDYDMGAEEDNIKISNARCYFNLNGEEITRTITQIKHG